MKDPFEIAKAEFRASLPAKVKEIFCVYDDFCKTKSIAEKKLVRESLVFHVHKLAGSSGTYSYAELSKNLFALEDQLMNGAGSFESSMRTLSQACSKIFSGAEMAELPVLQNNPEGKAA